MRRNATPTKAGSGFLWQVAEGFEHEAVRIEPERRVVLPILRELTWFVDDLGVPCQRPTMCFSHDLATRDEEAQVLKPGTVP